MGCGKRQSAKMVKAEVEVAVTPAQHWDEFQQKEITIRKLCQVAPAELMVSSEIETRIKTSEPKVLLVVTETPKAKEH